MFGSICVTMSEKLRSVKLNCAYKMSDFTAVIAFFISWHKGALHTHNS